MPRWVIACFLLLVVAGAGVWVWSAGVLDGFIAGFQTSDTTEKQVEQTPASELSTGSNASNEALDEDLQTLDAQLDAYAESSTELDESLNDEPVEQDPSF